MSKRHKAVSSEEEKTFSAADRQCGAVWFDNVPTHVPVTSLVQLLVDKSGSRLTPENIIASPRSDRGGILLKFEPKKYSDLAYELAPRLDFSGISVHPPSSVSNEAKLECVCFGVPTHHTDVDLLFFFNPRPVSAVRFVRKSGGSSTPTNTVKLTFQSEDVVKTVIQDGIRLGRARKRCKPFVKAPIVFCRRCKKPGGQHSDCEVICGWCQGKHATSLCEAKQRQEVPKCLRCSGEHAYFNCPEVRKLRADAVKRKQNQLSGHDPKAGNNVVSQSGGRVSPLHLAKQITPIIVEVVLQMLEAKQIVSPDDRDAILKLARDASQEVLSTVVNKVASEFPDALSDSKQSFTEVVSGKSSRKRSIDSGKMDGVEFTQVKSTSSSSSSLDSAVEEKQECKYCNRLFFKKGLGPHEKACANHARTQ